MSSALLYALSLIILLGLSLWERSYPQYQYEADRDWHLRLFSYAGLGLIATALVGFILEPYIEANAASKYLSSLPNWLSGLVAYLIITFFVYWWHRFRHHNNLAWKVFHQVHHSTYRLQAITALYAHPTDFVANLLIINLVCYGLLGLNIEAASWATLWVSVFEYWEHTNVRTPRWLGYFIVRPEMHRIHHERNRHSNNYGLPIWDLIFGTYENSNRQVECGFELQNESRVKEMLVCKQVE
ncbi:sterol desaturase family protein [Polynucleobacter sp. MWH-Braz-FAM2G]|uniref:sterol desaturase family protein n=1 Tax=Polynucleobacter sp. MWH-Braz-FAM2G TaxID=1855883 RepID=UPI001BFD3AB9|nr:sterol desaturase family protein [Polynucleobacter sp. MWH-Braz-FAM2G]QWD91780.1 sterol desaturase family protein [Polynucleobacter sp. MWH-Braz-FAM2G]